MGEPCRVKGDRGEWGNRDGCGKVVMGVGMSCRVGEFVTGVERSHRVQDGRSSGSPPCLMHFIPSYHVK